MSPVLPTLKFCSALPALFFGQGRIHTEKGSLKLCWTDDDSMGLRVNEQIALGFTLQWLSGFACKCFASLNSIYFAKVLGFWC